MRSRWLSTFTIIGIVLLGLGIVGVVLQAVGSPFVFDPGQPPPSTGRDWTPWYYVIIGAIMILNGLVTPAPVPGDLPPDKTARPRAERTASRTRPAAGREAIVTSAEKTGEP